MGADMKIRLGGPVPVRADDPAELAREHRRLGYAAAYCPPVSIDDGERLRAIRQAFEAEDVVIAEVGAWGNLIGPDEERRRANLQRACSALALADEIGARCCVDYLGTAGEGDWGPHADNLGDAGTDLAVETARHIIDEVCPRRAKFAFEMMQWCVPDSVDSYERLLRAVDRNAFAVHMDPVNIIVSPQMYLDTGAVIRACFARLGPQIASCHAKDIIARPRLALHFEEIRPGLGALDYGTYLSELAKLSDPPPLMLEHLSSADEYAQARRHILEVGRERDVNFA
jgi:sugar phosphate isomerase/epimerase